jgi:hypothetical protein
MKPTRLISGLVLALTLSVAPAIANEPTPVVATQAEVEVVKDAALEAVDAANAAVDAAKLATEAAAAASAIALEARSSADAAVAALAKLDKDIKALFADLTRQVTTIAQTMSKVAKKLGLKKA